MLKTKKYLKLKKSGNSYEYVETNDAGLGTLYVFLDEFYCYNFSKLRKLINDPTQKIGGKNEIYWEKEENNIIITVQYEDDPYENAFETTIEELNCIMDQWEELLKKMPEEIIVIRYDGTVILEGKN